VSRIEHSNTQRHAGNPDQAVKQRRKPDVRAHRTHARLGSAFVVLIHERPIEEVTVQDVLDRTSISRSTFYFHFRDKNDLLLRQLKTFLQTMSTVLRLRKEVSHRVVPVAEMFAHVENQRNLYRILADAGRLFQLDFLPSNKVNSLLV
jgi:AcrR family transcriptional regulator